MKRRVHTIWAILTSAMVALTGCRPQQPLYFHEKGDLSHYLNMATDLEYPDVKTETLADVESAPPPLTLSNPNFKNYWDLSLEEAVKTALSNAKAMRSLGGRYVSSAFNNRAQTGDAPDSLITNPDLNRTVYDPAITETTPFTGVEYALSAFDSQWTTNFFYQKNDHQQNVEPQFPITQFFRPVFQEDTSTFNTQLTKATATGGQLTVSNNIVYDFNNNPTRQVTKDWNTNYQVQFNQPLLAGSGVQYNRIAGPYNPVNFNPIPGGAQQTPGFDGVILARIAVDISLADFEGGVRNLVSDVENAYWELSFAWRNLNTSNTGLNSSRQTWKKIFLLYQVGTKGGEAKEEAQARAQYFQFKSQTQTLLNELYRAENRLRYIMGIATSDNRLIRPTDQPTVAKVEFDWSEITQEALARSLDLRRQKWRIKQRELELIAAKSLMLPRLDLNGTYRWLADGDNLFGSGVYNQNPGGPLLQGTSSLATLASGQFQEWQLGAQMTMTVGFRKELAQVRHYQLQLSKERARLQDEELEVSHQLADAVRQLELNYELTISNFNRALAADRQVEAVQAAFEAETVTLDQLLDAQRLRAEAEASFFRTLLDYQRAIIMVHYRKGSLLEYNNVYLTEGPWPAKAKFDAHRLARQRDASLYLNYGFTRPSVISQGAIRQNVTGQGELPRGLEGVSEGLLQKAATPATFPTPTSPTNTSPTTTSPTTTHDAMLPADGELHGVDSSSDAIFEDAPTQGAAATPRGFNWGSLGLGGQRAASGDAAGDLPTSAPADAADRVSPVRSAASMRRQTISQDGSVPGVKSQSWTPKHEPSVESEPSGAASGPAASGQGS
ncbi:MAG TPA: TolC family protein [Pirellulales bacterium]|nr:TolC family protein [Pirellulales bacterium]